MEKDVRSCPIFQDHVFLFGESSGLPTLFQDDCLGRQFLQELGQILRFGMIVHQMIFRESCLTGYFTGAVTVENTEVTFILLLGP